VVENKGDKAKFTVPLGRDHLRKQINVLSIISALSQIKQDIPEQTR
jgi:hypothetical protein